MNSLNKTILTALSIAVFGVCAIAQEGHSIGVDYKIGITILSHAYTSNNIISAVPQQSDFEFYSDAFFYNNFAFNYYYFTDHSYLKMNVEGLFYW